MWARAKAKVGAQGQDQSQGEGEGEGEGQGQGQSKCTSGIQGTVQLDRLISSVEVPKSIRKIRPPGIGLTMANMKLTPCGRSDR